MLYASLILSGLLCLAAFVAARRSRHPVLATVLCAALVVALPMGMTVFFPAVGLQAAVLVVGLALAAGFDRGRQSLRPLAVLSAVVAYAVVGWSVAETHGEHDRLRAAYPFESMEARLPRPVPPAAPGDPDRLAHLERAVAGHATNRSTHLRLLHEDTVGRFVNSPGFGVARMPRGPYAGALAGDPRDDAPDQPDYLRPVSAGPEGHPNPTAFGRLHEDGVLDFVNPAGFGFVKDRRQVAGFRSHGFSRVPDRAGGWEVARLELVGLLLHDAPAVYVSAKLPRMDELRDAPTRPPDAFETAALAALRAGADLHVGDGGRFLGAIRSTTQCVGCHGGDRGALLGAFTYRLRPAR